MAGRGDRWKLHGRGGEYTQAAPFKENKPSLIIAHTTKGKGVKEMEDIPPSWHHGGVPNQNLYEQAMIDFESMEKELQNV